ncbi:MAG: uncharacterized protein KVP18_000412 [Porospora cf. gigantea A]|uniref:uncharacterized protein n=1 Tax=Porospora cf. gigantea A TaxID=2853593 RepID=UPI003559FF2B|nr:MAG: hypothetical protein KVP18_000412 [Porospora cf. gigantea A]
MHTVLIYSLAWFVWAISSDASSMMGVLTGAPDDVLKGLMNQEGTPPDQFLQGLINEETGDSLRPSDEPRDVPDVPKDVASMYNQSDLDDDSAPNVSLFADEDSDIPEPDEEEDYTDTGHELEIRPGRLQQKDLTPDNSDADFPDEADGVQQNGLTPDDWDADFPEQRDLSQEDDFHDSGLPAAFADQLATLPAGMSTEGLMDSALMGPAVAPAPAMAPTPTLAPADDLKSLVQKDPNIFYFYSVVVGGSLVLVLLFSVMSAMEKYGFLLSGAAAITGGLNLGCFVTLTLITIGAHSSPALAAYASAPWIEYVIIGGGLLFVVLGVSISQALGVRQKVGLVLGCAALLIAQMAVFVPSLEPSKNGLTGWLLSLAIDPVTDSLLAGAQLMVVLVVAGGMLFYMNDTFSELLELDLEDQDDPDNLNVAPDEIESRLQGFEHLVAATVAGFMSMEACSFFLLYFGVAPASPLDPISFSILPCKFNVTEPTHYASIACLVVGFALVFWTRQLSIFKTKYDYTEAVKNSDFWPKQEAWHLTVDSTEAA